MFLFVFLVFSLFFSHVPFTASALAAFNKIFLPRLECRPSLVMPFSLLFFSHNLNSGLIFFSAEGSTLCKVCVVYEFQTASLSLIKLSV